MLFLGAAAQLYAGIVQRRLDYFDAANVFLCMSRSRSILASGRDFLYVFLCTWIVYARFDAATCVAHRLAQAVVVLRTRVYPCTDCRRQQLLDCVGRGHATVSAGNLPVLEKTTAKCDALIDRARVAAGGVADQHPCAGKCLAAGAVGQASIIKGLITSVVYTVYSMANATTVPVLLAWLFIAPIVYRLAKQSKMDFSHPLWAMVLLFGPYAALGMPRFYELGFAIQERNINLIYFSYYSVVLCAMYCPAGFCTVLWVGYRRGGSVRYLKNALVRSLSRFV